MLLELRGVEMAFGARIVLRGVDLDVRAGDVVGLVGPNGAGKSTLLRVAAGLLRPRRGSVRIGGLDARVARAHSRLGWSTSGEASFTRRLSLRSNLATAAGLAGLADRRARARVAELAERLGFADHLDVPAERCSSGVRQRAALARALLHRPALLLLDEPLRGVDAASSAPLRAALRDAARGAALLWVSHCAEDLEGAHRVLALADGRLTPAAARLPQEAAA